MELFCTDLQNVIWLDRERNANFDKYNYECSITNYNEFLFDKNKIKVVFLSPT